MLDGFMSSWSWPAGRAGGRDAGVRADVGPDRLPAIHFHGAVLAVVRRALLRSGGSGRARLGVLRGFRSCAPEDHVLFDGALPQSEAALIRPGAVVVPVGAAAGLRRPWRQGRVGGDGSLLQLFGAVAVPRLAGGGRGVGVCVGLSLPNFQLTTWPPLHGFDAPAVAEVSLGIVLRGGDTLREGEHVGFLVEKGKSPAGCVEPVFLSDDVGSRAIVGMWTLSERDVWTAAAVFAADSMTRRNAKVARPAAELAGRRTVDFLVAQFREDVGGDPVFLPCSVTLPSLNERQHISFTARVFAGECDHELLGHQIISANFAEDTEGGAVEQAVQSRPADHANAASSKSDLGSSQTAQQDAQAASPDAAVAAPSDGNAADFNGAQGGRVHLGHAQRSAVNRNNHSTSNEDAVLDQAREQQRDVNRRLDALNADLNSSVLRPQSPSDPPGNALGQSSIPGFQHAFNASSASASAAAEGDTMVPSGFSNRLDVLARKYLGEQYRSEFGMH